jgi:phosphoribosylformylglycinamidine synthase subunit PurQ / glutaminase
LRAAVVTFPGSNCDQDAVHVLRNLLAVPTDTVWHKNERLPEGVELVVLPGGFSYGDALRSGALARFSPVMGAVRAFAERGGRVLGICNGFQVLLEAGLLPGAMLQNHTQTFVCRVVRLEVCRADTPFTRKFEAGRQIRLPVAHHEGRYHLDPEELETLEARGGVAFRYIDDPNGSVGRVAGVLNAEGNVLGLMPHPERAAEAVLGGEDGLALFRSVVEAT